MGADKTLLREIEKATVSITTVEEKRAFINRIDDALEDFNRSDVTERFNDFAAKHGRVMTALILAGTIIDRKEDIGDWNLPWAMDVAAAWHNKPVNGGAKRAAIHSFLHPTRICYYAADFIAALSE